MKQMWIDCALCGKQVRNSLTEVHRHATACAGSKIEEAQRVAVGAIAERNQLRIENDIMRGLLKRFGVDVGSEVRT